MVNVTQRWKYFCLFLWQTTIQTWWRWTGQWRSQPVKPWCCGVTSRRSSSVLGTLSAICWPLGPYPARATDYFLNLWILNQLLLCTSRCNTFQRGDSLCVWLFPSALETRLHESGTWARAAREGPLSWCCATAFGRGGRMYLVTKTSPHWTGMWALGIGLMNHEPFSPQII